MAEMQRHEQLAALQARMARALLDGDGADLDLAPGPITAAEALGLHRNTALYGLVNALRLTYPTVDALVGEAFFDQAALAFVQQQPPRSPCLADYGAQFPAFTTGYAPAQGLPYLGDVARLDRAVAQVAGGLAGQDGIALDLGEAVLVLDASLTLLMLDHPADAIRDAVEAGDAALGALDVSPRPTALALWRRGAGAAVRALSPLPAAFLGALLEGRDPEWAIAPLLAQGADPARLQEEVLAAPFARLAASPPPGAQP
jgi:hypothetical protein